MLHLHWPQLMRQPRFPTALQLYTALPRCRSPKPSPGPGSACQKPHSCDGAAAPRAILGPSFRACSGVKTHHTSTMLSTSREHKSNERTRNVPVHGGATERSDSERWHRGPAREFGTLRPGLFGRKDLSWPFWGKMEGYPKQSISAPKTAFLRWRRGPEGDFGTLLPGLLGRQDTSYKHNVIN